MVLMAGRARLGRIKEISLGKLRDKLVTERNHQEDFDELRGRDMTFHNDGTISFRPAGTQRFAWNKWAFQQFANRIEIPTEFLRRSPLGEGPASQKALVDHHKEAIDGAKFLVRVKKLDTPDKETGAVGLVRAFLSDRYSKLDNLDFVDLVTPMIEKHQMKVQLGEFNDQSFHMRLLFPEEIDVGNNPNKPDIHNIGIHARNSEVGAYNAMGDYLLFRQICTNGLVAMVDREHLFNQKHIGIDRHSLRASILASVEKVERRVDEMVGRIQEVARQTIVNPVLELERTLKGSKATEDFVNAAKIAYESEPIATKFGIIQAITRAAQDFPIETRVSMEEMAGRYLLAA